MTLAIKQSLPDGRGSDVFSEPRPSGSDSWPEAFA
jgi:hypothetical protein